MSDVTGIPFAQCSKNTSQLRFVHYESERVGSRVVGVFGRIFDVEIYLSMEHQVATISASGVVKHYLANGTDSVAGSDGVKINVVFSDPKIHSCPLSTFTSRYSDRAMTPTGDFAWQVSEVAEARQNSTACA
jgi:hypothetical protein